jgi:hypothetical protein
MSILITCTQSGYSGTNLDIRVQIWIARLTQRKTVHYNLDPHLL